MPKYARLLSLTYFCISPQNSLILMALTWLGQNEVRVLSPGVQLGLLCTQGEMEEKKQGERQGDVIIFEAA